MLKKKKFTITLSSIVLVLALSIGLSMFYFRKTKAMTEEEARAYAADYLPEGIYFVTAADTGDEFELIYFDDRSGRTYRVEIAKSDGELYSLVAQSVMGKEGSEIKIQSEKIKNILESEFPDAVLTNYGFVEGGGDGLGSIELLFDWRGFNGTMMLNPETGLVLSFRLKRSARVVIPLGPDNDNSRFLNKEEAIAEARDYIGDAKILDLELELDDDRYVYEIYASDRDYLYVLSLDAETGERIRLRSTSRSLIAAPTGETTAAKEADPTAEATPSDSHSRETSEATTTAEPQMTTETATASTSAVAVTPTPAVTPAATPSASTTTATPQPTTPPKAVIPLPTNDDDWDDIVKYAPEISRERAVEIALGRIPGSGSAHVSSIDLDEDDGVLSWEIEVDYQGREYEVRVHARNGSVLSIEEDD